MPVMKVVRLLPAQRISLTSQLDGRGHNLLQCELAVFPFGVDHPCNRPWHADRLVADFARSGDYIALSVHIHVAGRRRGSFLAVIEEMRFAVGHADEHESAAADISRG